MPYVSLFFGIVIRMFHNEHPPPHFHAEHQGQRGQFSFDGTMVKGNIRSRRAQKLIREWALLHQQELANNWKKAADGLQLDKIAPLD